MFLSELHLNPRSRDARRDLASPYEMHRTLKRAFPEGEPDANRLLFRLEGAAEEGTSRVLVQCVAVAPDWTHLPEDYCRLVMGPKSVAPALIPGEIYAFRLHANPTVKRQKRRFGLMKEEEHLEWLRRKGSQGGFTVAQANAASYQLGGRWHGPPSRENKASIPHFGVGFDGLLRVDDAALLLQTLRSGIGSAKSFGFGLMTLAPLR